MISLQLTHLHFIQQISVNNHLKWQVCVNCSPKKQPCTGVSAYLSSTGIIKVYKIGEEIGWRFIFKHAELLLLQGCIIQQFLDKIHVWQEHPATAVPLQTQSVKSITVKVRKCQFYTVKLCSHLFTLMWF